MDCIIQSLCSPLLIDCSRIKLPRISLDGNQYGRSEIRSHNLHNPNVASSNPAVGKKHFFHFVNLASAPCS